MRPPPIAVRSSASGDAPASGILRDASQRASAPAPPWETPLAPTPEAAAPVAGRLFPPSGERRTTLTAFPSRGGVRARRPLGGGDGSGSGELGERADGSADDRPPMYGRPAGECIIAGERWPVAPGEGDRAGDHAGEGDRSVAPTTGGVRSGDPAAAGIPGLAGGVCPGGSAGYSSAPSSVLQEPPWCVSGHERSCAQFVAIFLCLFKAQSCL